MEKKIKRRKIKLNKSEIPVRRQDFPVLKELLLKTYCQHRTLWDQSSSKTNLLVSLLLFTCTKDPVVAADSSNTGSSCLP